MEKPCRVNRSGHYGAGRRWHVDPAEAERLLQVEIRYLREQLNRAYAQHPDGTGQLLAVSRVLDRVLLRYQDAFAEHDAASSSSSSATPSQ